MPYNEKKVCFRLKRGRDDVIIKWLEGLGKDDRSYYIREGLRAYLRGEELQVPSSTKSSARCLDLTEKVKGRIGESANKKDKDTVVDDSTLETNFVKWFEQ